MPLPEPSRFNGNPFVPIDSGIPAVFDHKPHPLTPFEDNHGLPIETNKFYANMLLESRTLPAFSHPYSVWWSQTPNLLGMAVSHTQESQRVFGPNPAANPCQYYFNPAGIQSVNFGAIEFTEFNVSLVVDNCRPFSVEATLKSGNGTIRLPLYNGMGVVTGIYNGLSPSISSVVGFHRAHKIGSTSSYDKYELLLYNQVRWLMYVSGNRIDFELKNPNHFVARSSANGAIVQIGECPQGADQIYDLTAGAYATSVSLEGNVRDGKTATYKLVYKVQGSSSSERVLIYALPHQVESFTPATAQAKTTLTLDSTVMGKMTACVVDALEMQEDLPYYIGFLPWSVVRPTRGDKFFNCNKYSRDDLELMRRAATEELNQDIISQCCLDSMYFSGKGLDKFAFILLVTRYILGDIDLTKRGLDKLKEAFAVFTRNKQIYPLVYDTTWKGLISVAGYNDPNADFGNTYYNDHHFHYGYFFHAAAVIGQIDREFGGNWIDENKHWVNSLVRDVSNPSDQDCEFPVSRSFDWFVGHSWAKGLFISGDGKDEESSSEDYHFAYGVKLWGQIIGDQAMETRGNLMLAIMRRAMNKYMLFSDDNREQPPNFIKNKVSGITFENKVDHATYFGLKLEYIQGIHMIPLTPVSSYIRSPQFVKEEWEGLIGGIVDTVDDGWKGILKLNQALYDPLSSSRFFTDSNFKPQWLDGGMSRTWSIAFSKGLF